METGVMIESGARRRVSVNAVVACAWPALLLATACLLPFLNKAFNIDDPLFLMMARQIVRHPLRPMGFNACWNATSTVNYCGKAYSFATGNMLMGYLLVPTVLGGGHEWMAHLTQLGLVWIATVAMASLILRLGSDRWQATAGALLLVAVAPFLPMASTAIPDILATTLALLGMERLAAWKAEQKWTHGGAAALALGLAGLARIHMALLLPLSAFFLLESVKPEEIVAQIRRNAWLWAPVAAGSLILWAAILALREHNLAIDPPPFLMGWWNIPRNLAAYLLYFTVLLPLTPSSLANRLRTGRLRAVVKLFALAFIVIASQWLMGKEANLAELGLPLTVIFLAVVGCGVLSGLFLEAWRKRDHTALFLMLWILIPLPIVCYVQLPIRYLLPCMPAVILLCFRLMDGFSVRMARAAAVALIVASAGYSVLILRSDAEFAEFGRDALHDLIAPRVAVGEKVWFGGQYWSYWYAPLDGATPTSPGGPQPKPGDLYVSDVLADGRNPPIARFPHRTLVETISHKYRFGRTMGGGMGLYSNGWGYWLWGFGEDPKDRFELWRIN